MESLRAAAAHTLRERELWLNWESDVNSIEYRQAVVMTIIAK